jgi:hypothetical protein
VVARLFRRSRIPAGLCLALLAGFALAHFGAFQAPARAQEPPQQQQNVDVKKIRDLLGQMNVILRRAHDDYLRGKLDEEGLRQQLDEVRHLKFQVMDQLARPFGPGSATTFTTLYVDLAAIDRELDLSSSATFDLFTSRFTIAEWIDLAMRNKKALEGLVPR